MRSILRHTVEFLNFWRLTNTMSRVLLCTALVLSTFTSASAQQVENFVLLDQKGDAHELFYHRNDQVVVILAQSNACSSNAAAMRQFQSLSEAYANEAVSFYMLNSSLNEQRAELALAAAENSSTLPILDDATQLIGESLNLRQAGEVLVVDPASWQITYRGPLLNNDMPMAQNSDVITAIEAIRHGDVQMPIEDETKGCPISYAQGTHTQISYSDTIAPILQTKCIVCHTEGGLGPWAMSGYNMIRGFAPMMREVIRTKRMPPWHADPHVGVWKNDISLTTQESQNLVHWIEAGTPRGDGPDPLAETQTAQLLWPLGKPDLILDIPAYTVPASGVVDYQFPRVKNPLTTAVWIKAATIVPGNREVVHHILAGTQDHDTTDLRRTSGVFDNYIIGYAPGNESNQFPQDTGIFIPPGGDFLFQLHYTPVGREIIDTSRIGLYFHDKTPGNFFRQGVVINPMLKIPPLAARHKEIAYYAFDKPVQLHNLVPHAHYRGVSSRFELQKPDGSTEIILNIPNYDFNWQRTYEFVIPKHVDAGSKLIHTTWYDNSANNLGNPDPTREVPWGLQSWDEMLYGAFSYTYVNENTEAPIHDRLLARTKQYVGFLDQNFDDKLSWRELPKPLKKRLLQGFAAVDRNGDGSLDTQEMHQLTLRRENPQ